MQKAKIHFSIFFIILFFFGQIVFAESCGNISYEKNSISNPVDEDDSIDDDSSSAPNEISGGYGKVEMSSPSKSKSKPELYVKELKFRNEKTKYYDDENITVYCYVKNVGTNVSKKITKISVRLYRFKGEKENGDTKQVDDENIKGENLKSGKTKKEEFKFSSPNDEGKYQFYAIVDAKKTVGEANERNNRMGNIICRVHKRPDIKVKNLILGDGEIEFVQGEIFEIRATFKNDGGESFEDVPVRWYLNNIHYANDNMRHWNIEKGDEKHESINVDTSFLSIGAHTIKVCADCEADKDKGNNCQEITFEVTELVREISYNICDFNQDGKVNMTDFMIFRQNLNQTGDNIADLNDDGVVDMFDFVIFKSNYE